MSLVNKTKASSIKVSGGGRSGLLEQIKYNFRSQRLLFLGSLRSSRQAEIAYLYDHVVCEENVSELQVAMDDTFAVEVSQAGHDLLSNVAHLLFGQVLLSAQVLGKALWKKKNAG